MAKEIEKFILVDVETAGGFDNPLCYDVGLMVTDRKGTEYETLSLVIYNIYAEQRELMKSAYYADKLPSYEIKLANGERKMVKFYTAKKLVRELMEKHNISKVYAYNLNFDRRALNNTERFTTDERFKYFFPYGTEFCCIWHIACQILMSRPTYIKFALENNFITPKGNIMTNAESCYRYLINDATFEEAHEGLDDVIIEKEILLASFRQHKKMDKKPYQPCWRIVQKKYEEMFGLTKEEEEKLEYCKELADSLSNPISTSARRYRSTKILTIMEEYPKLKDYIYYDDTQYNWKNRFDFLQGLNAPIWPGHFVKK